MSIIKTAEIIPMKSGRECHICGESFELRGYYDTRNICPECRKRLKALLYPEKEE